MVGYIVFFWFKWGWSYIFISLSFYRSMNKKWLILIIFGLLIIGGIIMAVMKNSVGTSDRVLLKTNMGDIVIELDKNMPITAGNFESLVKKGFYNGVIFHRVIPGFMIQGGDPTGTGMGGPGYKIKDEFTSGNANNRGTISMANSGPDTGGSQFFINLVDNNFLDGKHPVFGRVVSGMEIVDAIGKVKTSAGDRPVEDVVILEARVA